jgi:hypothetical protein
MQAGAPDERVDGYAAALVEVARAEGQLARVADELFGFAREFERNDALRLALTDQQLPPDRRQAIAEEVLGQKASHLSASLVSFVIGAGRARHMVAIADRLVERAAQERQREVAEVPPGARPVQGPRPQRRRKGGRRPGRARRGRGPGGGHRHRRLGPSPSREAARGPVRGFAAQGELRSARP